MKAWVLMIVGALITLMGVVWALQGLGYVGGSPMTGVTLWAIVGPVVALVGAGLVVAGIRRLRN
jgi:hypothetical protein